MSTKKKYHINIHGIPAQCGADMRNCPRGGQGGDADHFDTWDEANRVAQDRMKQEHGETASVSKPVSVTSDAVVAYAEAVNRRSRQAREVAAQAEAAENELHIKRQNFEHDDEMQVVELNRNLPEFAAMADPSGRTEHGGGVATLDQVYPSTLVYYDPQSDRYTNFHYTQTGRLGRVTGDFRDTTESKSLESELDENPALKLQIKGLAITRIKTAVAHRRQVDMRKTRAEALSLAEGSDVSKEAQNVKSVERFAKVAEDQQNSFGKDINAHSDTVQVVEVKPPGGRGPSSYFINHDGEEGIDVTALVTERGNRYVQAGTKSGHGDIHRDATITYLEAIQQEADQRNGWSRS